MMLHIVYKVSSVGASTFGKALNYCRTHFGLEDRQSTCWICKFSVTSRKNPFYSTYSLAKVLDVSHTTVLTQLRDCFGMKLFHLRWIPHELTEQLRAMRVQKCQELLPLLKSMETRSFRKIVTGEESWFTLEFPDATRLSVSRDDVSTKVMQQIATKKFMRSVI
jgi:hypothetical protein